MQQNRTLARIFHVHTYHYLLDSTLLSSPLLSSLQYSDPTDQSELSFSPRAGCNCPFSSPNIISSCLQHRHNIHRSPCAICLRWIRDKQVFPSLDRSRNKPFAIRAFPRYHPRHMPPSRTRRGQIPSTSTTLSSGAETTWTICTETHPSRRPLCSMGFPRHRVTRQIILWQPPIRRPVVARCGATAKALVHSSALHGWIGLDHNRLKGRVSLNTAHFFMKATLLQALPPSTPT